MISLLREVLRQGHCHLPRFWGAWGDGSGWFTLSGSVAPSEPPALTVSYSSLFFGWFRASEQRLPVLSASWPPPSMSLLTSCAVISFSTRVRGTETSTRFGNPDPPFIDLALAGRSISVKLDWAEKCGYWVLKGCWDFLQVLVNFRPHFSPLHRAQHQKRYSRFQSKSKKKRKKEKRHHRWELVQFFIMLFYFFILQKAFREVEWLAQSGTLVQVGSGPGSALPALVFPPPPHATHGQDFTYISSQPHWDQSRLLPIYFGALFLWQ